MDIVLGIAVVIATLAGPVLAVIVTRHNDEKRQRRSRQLDIFRMLMRTRRSLLSIDHVTALNMVEIDFDGVSSVLVAFKNLHRHLNLTAPFPVDWQDKRIKLQTKLLSEMAKSLGYQMEQLDVLEGGYAPQGWQTTEDEQQQLRRLLIELLSSRRSLPVSAAAPTPPPPFPPAPPPIPRG